MKFGQVKGMYRAAVVFVELLNYVRITAVRANRLIAYPPRAEEHNKTNALQKNTCSHQSFCWLR